MRTDNTGSKLETGESAGRASLMARRNEDMEKSQGTKPLRIGIAGLGVAGAVILREVAQRSHWAVTAAADIRGVALEAFAREYGGETYTSVEAMCESPNVDVIYVCTPNHLHAPNAICAAEHGKQIIVDKPMAVTLDECTEMCLAAERNGVRLLCGHTHSFDPPIQKMREMVRSGELGRLGMINTWYFKDHVYQPRMPQEFDAQQGGNAVFNQGSHQADIVRFIGGGMVRSVRGMTGVWDPSRRMEGAWSAFLEFEDGVPATLVFSGYAHFNTAELTSWAGESGWHDPDRYLRTRRELAALAGPEEEWALREAERYGGARQRPAVRDPDRPQPHFGLTIVSCEHGDIRQSPHGLWVYGDDATWEVPIAANPGSRTQDLDEMYQAVLDDHPVWHDGRWGTATMEVVLAIMQSARERREIPMSHQVPSPD